MFHRDEDTLMPAVGSMRVWTQPCDVVRVVWLLTVMNLDRASRTLGEPLSQLISSRCCFLWVAVVSFGLLASVTCAVNTFPSLSPAGMLATKRVVRAMWCDPFSRSRLYGTASADTRPAWDGRASSMTWRFFLEWLEKTT